MWTRTYRYMVCKPPQYNIWSKVTSSPKPSDNSRTFCYWNLKQRDFMFSSKFYFLKPWLILNKVVKQCIRNATAILTWINRMKKKYICEDICRDWHSRQHYCFNTIQYQRLLYRMYISGKTGYRSTKQTENNGEFNPLYDTKEADIHCTYLQDYTVHVYTSCTCTWTGIILFHMINGLHNVEVKWSYTSVFGRFSVKI